MADKLSDAANVESGIRALHRMNRRKILAKRVGAFCVGVLKSSGISNALKIDGIRLSLSVIGQREEVFRISQRYRCPVFSESTDIHGTHVPRKRIEGAVIPQETLSAV